MNRTFQHKTISRSRFTIVPNTHPRIFLPTVRLIHSNTQEKKVKQFTILWNTPRVIAVCKACLARPGSSETAEQFTERIGEESLANSARNTAPSQRSTTTFGSGTYYLKHFSRLFLHSKFDFWQFLFRNFKNSFLNFQDFRIFSEF